MGTTCRDSGQSVPVEETCQHVLTRSNDSRGFEAGCMLGSGGVGHNSRDVSELGGIYLIPLSHTVIFLEKTLILGHTIDPVDETVRRVHGQRCQSISGGAGLGDKKRKKFRMAVSTELCREGNLPRHFVLIVTDKCV